MGRELSGNTWIDGVYYAEGTSEAEVGSAAGSIGEHLWREDGSSELSASPAAPESEQSFRQEEQGPSVFAPAEPPAESAPVEAEPAEAEPVEVSDGSPAVEPAEVFEEPSVTEVAPEAPPDVLAIQPPPRSGKGSSEHAWREYALSVGVHTDEANDRAEVIAMIEAAGKPI